MVLISSLKDASDWNAVLRFEVEPGQHNNVSKFLLTRWSKGVGSNDLVFLGNTKAAQAQRRVNLAHLERAWETPSENSTPSIVGCYC